MNHLLHSYCIILQVCLHFGHTRGMAVLTDPTTPPSTKRIDSQNSTQSLDTVVPHPAATLPLSSQMQRKHDQSCVTKSHRIANISDLTHIRLCCCIQKICDMLTNVVEALRDMAPSIKINTAIRFHRRLCTR